MSGVYATTHAYSYSLANNFPYVLMREKKTLFTNLSASSNFLAVIETLTVAKFHFVHMLLPLYYLAFTPITCSFFIYTSYIYAYVVQ